MTIQFCEQEKLNILHFQHNIYDFANGYYEILQQEVFCKEIKKYVKRLFELGHTGTILKILAQAGECSVGHGDHRLRLRAIEIVTFFSELLKKKKDKDLFQAVVPILARWLGEERVYFLIYEKAFSQIESVVSTLFSLRLWSQTQPLLAVTREIVSGNIATSQSFKRQVSKLHRDIADPDIIDSLVRIYLTSKKSPLEPSTLRLLQAMVPYSSESIIHGLFKCTAKEKRLELINILIVARSNGALPILVDKLKDKQRWWVIRNSIILLGHIQDPDLFFIARPFLRHPDQRVQSETVNCIATLGGDDVAERLIEAFSVIGEDIKDQIFDLLIPCQQPNIEKFFRDILEEKISVTPATREKLIVLLCEGTHSHLSSEVLFILKNIVIAGEYIDEGFDPALDAARNLFDKLKDVDNLS